MIHQYAHHYHEDVDAGDNDRVLLRVCADGPECESREKAYMPVRIVRDPMGNWRPL